MKKANHNLILTFVILILLITACTTGQATPTLASTDIPTAQTTAAVLPTAAAPEATDEPALSLVSSEIVLWAGMGSVHNEVLVERLSAFAQANGSTFESHTSLSAQQITPSVKVLVTTVDANQIEALHEQLPGLKIIAVDVGGLTPALVNVHQVTSEGGTVEQRAFLAGYALALTTSDYRVGAITLSGDDLGDRNRDSFITGVRYFCGLCSARYMPVNYYPFTAEVTAPSNPTDWQTAVDSLLELAVTAIFVQPELSSIDLMSYLASKNITVIGVEGQPGLDVAGRVVGVLGSDLYASTEAAVARILNGEDLGSSTGSLELKQIDREIMSDGRRILFERIREELLSGMIKDRP